VKVPWAIEKNVCCAAAGWNTLQMSIMPIWSIMSFNSEVSLLTFFSWWPMHWWKWDFEVHSTIVKGSICAFKSSSICLMKLHAPTYGSYMLTIAISSQLIFLFIYMKWPSLSPLFLAQSTFYWIRV
jgi:hypothetical protein